MPAYFEAVLTSHSLSTVLRTMLGKLLRDRVECIIYGLFLVHVYHAELN